MPNSEIEHLVEQIQSAALNRDAQLKLMQLTNQRIKELMDQISISSSSLETVLNIRARHELIEDRRQTYQELEGMASPQESSQPGN